MFSFAEFAIYFFRNTFDFQFPTPTNTREWINREGREALREGCPSQPQPPLRPPCPEPRCISSLPEPARGTTGESAWTGGGDDFVRGDGRHRRGITTTKSADEGTFAKGIFGGMAEVSRPQRGTFCCSSHRRMRSIPCSSWPDTIWREGLEFSAQKLVLWVWVCGSAPGYDGRP